MTGASRPLHILCATSAWICPFREASKFPSWYASPGNTALTGPGESSFRCAGITPQAPCTMNCIRNPPTASIAAVWLHIHNGITGTASNDASTIVRLRPNLSDNAPKQYPADKRAHRPDNRHQRCHLNVQPLVVLQKRGVKILRPMAERVKPEHQQCQETE